MAARKGKKVSRRAAAAELLARRQAAARKGAATKARKRVDSATMTFWRSTGPTPYQDAEQEAQTAAFRGAMNAAWKAQTDANKANPRANMASASESNQRAAYDALQTIQRVGVTEPPPATESALKDLQAALSNLGSEVIQSRAQLELVLQPSCPRAEADSNSLCEPPRSPLTRSLRGMIADANGTAEMVRDIRDRLEIGAQEPGL